MMPKVCVQPGWLPWETGMNKGSMIMKHSMHSAQDQLFEYEVDPIKRTLDIKVDEIDTSLLEWFLTVTVVDVINGRINKEPKLASLKGYRIEMVVAAKARFGIQIREHDYDPMQRTI